MSASFTTQDLAKKTSEKLEIVRHELSRNERNPLRFVFHFPGEPVRRKLLETIYERLSALSAELSGDDAVASREALSEVDDALALIESRIAANDAWHIADSLSAALPGVSSDAALHRILRAELVRDAKDGIAWPEADEVGRLLGGYEETQNKFRNEEIRNQAAAGIRSVRLLRNDAGRHGRARAGTRKRYLIILAFVLWPLATLLMFGKPVAGLPLDPEAMFMVLVAGVLGSVISGAIKIRNLDRISDLAAVWSGLFAQMAIGATLAEVVIVILKSGFVTLGGNDGIAMWTTVGFVAGFSEPFALKILERVSGHADNLSNGAAEEQPPRDEQSTQQRGGSRGGPR